MEWEWQLQLLTRMKKGFESARKLPLFLLFCSLLAFVVALHVLFPATCLCQWVYRVFSHKFRQVVSVLGLAVKANLQ